MPKTTKSGDAKQSEIPSTLQRSDEKAQRTFAKAHDSAMDSYDDEQRANQVAWAAVKHTHEKIGDHWEQRTSSGPLDKHAKGGRDDKHPTRGGVNENASKSELYEKARKAGIDGRSNMSKDELVDALQKYNDRETRRARQGNK